MALPDSSRVPGSPGFNPFPPGSIEWGLLDHAKALGGHSEACWKILELSSPFAALASRDGPEAVALARAARCLALGSPAHLSYWRSRGIDPADAELSGLLCARRILTAPRLDLAPPSHWHLLLSAALDPEAPPSHQALGKSLWAELPSSARREAALSSARQIGSLSEAFAPLANRLRPRDRSAAAQLCFDLCSLSPELASACQQELRLMRLAGRAGKSGKAPLEWLERRLEGLEIESSTGAASSSRSDSAPRL